MSRSLLLEKLMKNTQRYVSRGQTMDVKKLNKPLKKFGSLSSQRRGRRSILGVQRTNIKRKGNSSLDEQGRGKIETSGGWNKNIDWKIKESLLTLMMYDAYLLKEQIKHTKIILH
jgi:hypothetical protein